MRHKFGSPIMITDRDMQDDPGYECMPELILANQALRRMKRAYEKGSGCKLSKEEIQSLCLTIVGQLWNAPEPSNIK